MVNIFDPCPGLVNEELWILVAQTESKLFEIKVEGMEKNALPMCAQSRKHSNMLEPHQNVRSFFRPSVFTEIHKQRLI